MIRQLSAPLRSRIPPGISRRRALGLIGLGLALGRAGGAAAAPGRSGQLTIGSGITLAPTWFDPAETSGIITPYQLLYALHDAVVKPMPGEPMAACLAQSWGESDDGLAYEFVLRPDVRFHNGDPVTAEDVKFSFARYRGTSAALIHARVAAVETPDPSRVRFTLKQPWPDFMTFYASATSAGWIVPKKYVEKIGDEAFKKAPVGAGPYKFVSFTPGIELTLEAFEPYWRKPPAIKRVVFKVIPDDATRLAALLRGEVDIAAIRGELAEGLERTAGFTLKSNVIDVPFWLYFAEQWDPKSPWYDRRVRQAAGLAIDRHAINEAVTLGRSRITGSFIPDGFEHYWQPPAPRFDRAAAKRLLAEAGHPNGFDAGDYVCDAYFSNIAEAVINDLQAVGIRCKLRPLERAAFFKGYAERTHRNIIQGSSGAFGNAATRLEAFAVKGGTYAYGSEPEIDALFQQQVAELDRAKRAAILQRMQEIVHERALFTPIWQLASLFGVGPRVGESGFGRIRGFPYSVPYEDLTLKNA
jgi:peptide/nickel transport system substrate-binding protein